MITCNFVSFVQTWDLLQMMYNGFKGLLTEFVPHHAAHYIVPVRVTGSCIESLFSRFKYSANGNLSAVNYETAMSNNNYTNS